MNENQMVGRQKNNKYVQLKKPHLFICPSADNLSEATVLKMPIHLH